jgi:hypothetical protein
MSDTKPQNLINKSCTALALLFGCLLISSCMTAEEARERPASRMPTPAEVEQYNAMVPPEERIVCRSEIPVGSNIPVRKCRLLSDIDETSTFHREQLRRALR